MRTSYQGAHSGRPARLGGRSPGARTRGTERGDVDEGGAAPGGEGAAAASGGSLLDASGVVFTLDMGSEIHKGTVMSRHEMRNLIVTGQACFPVQDFNKYMNGGDPVTCWYEEKREIKNNVIRDAKAGLLTADMAERLRYSTWMEVLDASEQDDDLKRLVAKYEYTVYAAMRHVWHDCIAKDIRSGGPASLAKLLATMRGEGIAVLAAFPRFDERSLKRPTSRKDVEYTNDQLSAMVCELVRRAVKRALRYALSSCLPQTADQGAGSASEAKDDAMELVESIPLHVHVTNEAIATSWALPPSALGLCGKGNYVFVLDVGGRTTDGALSRCAKGGLFIISYASTTAMSGTVVTEKLLKIARERLLQAGPALAIGRHLTAKEVNDAKKDLRPELEYYQISLRQFTGPLKEAVIQANKMSGAKQEDEDVDEPELCVPTSALWEQLNTVDGDATEMGSPISAIKDLLRNARSKVPAKCQLLVVGSGGALKTWNLQEELRAYCEELGNTRLTEGSMGAGSMVLSGLINMAKRLEMGRLPDEIKLGLQYHDISKNAAAYNWLDANEVVETPAGNEYFSLQDKSMESRESAEVELILGARLPGMNGNTVILGPTLNVPVPEAWPIIKAAKKLKTGSPQFKVLSKPRKGAGAGLGISIAFPDQHDCAGVTVTPDLEVQMPNLIFFSTLKFDPTKPLRGPLHVPEAHVRLLDGLFEAVDGAQAQQPGGAAAAGPAAPRLAPQAGAATNGRQGKRKAAEPPQDDGAGPSGIDRSNGSHRVLRSAMQHGGVA